MLRDKQTRGEFVADKNKDALYFALGEKQGRSGRVAGLGGVNVGYKTVFGPLTRKTSNQGSGITSTEDREALKSELRKEITNDLLTLLQQLGIEIPKNLKLPRCTQDNQHDPECTNQEIQHDPKIFLELEVSFFAISSMVIMMEDYVKFFFLG